MSNPRDEKCPVCGAKPDDPCVNTLHPGQPLPGRIVHMGRTQDFVAWDLEMWQHAGGEI
jgi:hypothetical protein